MYLGIKKGSYVQFNQEGKLRLGEVLCSIKSEGREDLLYVKSKSGVRRFIKASDCKLKYLPLGGKLYDADGNQVDFSVLLA